MKTAIAFYKTVLDNLYEGIYFVDRDRKIIFWNKGAERITGFRSSEVVGKACSDDVLQHVDARGRSLCTDICPLSAAMCDGEDRNTDIFLRHKNGHRVAVTVRVAAVRNEQGNIEGGVEIFQESTQLESSRDRLIELERLAFLDELTRLANRRYAEITLKARLEELERYGWGFGALFVDIDHFKKINDKYGHAIGDDVLKMVAKTLENSVRSFDIVSRWGGEEFLVIITHVEGKELIAMANRCKALVAQSSIPSVPSLRVTISLGGTLARPDDTVASILKRVDGLMYQSKEAGRDRVTTDCA